MEELIELIKTELSIDAFSLIILIQQIELKIYNTLSILLNHWISCCDAKLVIKINQLRVVHLWQEAFKFSCFLSFKIEDAFNCTENASGIEVFCDSTFLDKGCILFFSTLKLLHEVYEFDRIFKEWLHIFHFLAVLFT